MLISRFFTNVLVKSFNSDDDDDEEREPTAVIKIQTQNDLHNSSPPIIRPGVNFTNILRAAFCTKEFCTAFLCTLELGFVIFWLVKIGAKAAHKMLVKLTTATNTDNKAVQRPKSVHLQINTPNVPRSAINSPTIIRCLFNHSNLSYKNQ